MKKELTALYGQAPRLSTSFQTREFCRHLEKYFSIRSRELPDAFVQFNRMLRNYFLPAIQRPKADLLLYGNDGLVDLRHWRAQRILYWYDAPQDWSKIPPGTFKDNLRCENVRVAEHVFAVSAAQVRVAKALRPGRENSVHYLPVGVDCEFFKFKSAEFRQKYRFNSETVVIGYLGYLGQWKNRFAGEMLLEAAAALKSSNIAFLVIGTGPAMPSWRQKVRDLGMEDRFVFTGFIPTSDLPSALAATDICVDTLEPGFHSEARSETKLKQYMAMGRACAATDIGENRVDLDDGHAGLLAQPNSSSLGDCILRLIHDPEARARFGVAARARAEAVYAWPKLAERFVSALDLR